MPPKKQKSMEKSKSMEKPKPIEKPETTVSHLPTRNINKSGCGSNAPTHVSAKSVNLSASPSASNSANVERKANAVDKRFNIVIYGLVECPKGSPRHVRLSHDTNLACGDYQICMS